MLWVIFPIPDPVTSFKKIHVPIRLAHRRSFNEQINHSDGYNGVITGFKYDHLHPNGAAEPWLKAKKKKKVDGIGESFILFSIWTHSRDRKPWVVQRGRFGKIIIIQLPPSLLQEVACIGSWKHSLACVALKWRDSVFPIFSVVLHFLPNSKLIFPSVRKDEERICRW
jgi:hypothetical protein